MRVRIYSHTRYTKKLDFNMRYKIVPKSSWARQMVDKYGSTLKLGKYGKESWMFVNDGCTDLMDDTFIWGFWIDLDEADFEEVSGE